MNKINPETKPITDVGPRCQQCNKMLAYEATRPWSIKCNRCGHITNTYFK